MISKYKDDVLFCGFLYLPSFIHSLLNQTTTFLLEMLWDSAAPATTFTLCSDSYTHFSKSRVRDSRTPLSGYFTMWTINFGCNLKKKSSLGSLPSQELPSLWSSPTPMLVKPLFLWSALHCPTVIFPFIRMGGIGRNRKNAYISLNTAFLLLPSANSVNPFSSTALNKPSERPLLLLPIKAKEIR